MVTCRVKGKAYKCKVTVVDKRTVKDSTALNITVTEKASDSDLCPDLPTREYLMTIVTRLGLDPGPVSRAECGPGPYGVSKIMVTCDGKDVTNEVKYEIDNPNAASVTSPGVISLTMRGYFFNLTVSYKGMKRTFKINKVKSGTGYILCYCGEPIGDSLRDNYNKHATENMCGGCWIGDFANALDIEIA